MLSLVGQGFSPGWAGLVFLLALVPRLAHVYFVSGTPLASEFVPDLPVYLHGVSRLMHGAYFFREPMVMSPGYSLLLAPLYILAGPNIPLFVLVNAVLDAGSAALCAMLAARLAPQGRELAFGLAAGVLYALCGQIVFYALLPLSEGPAMFFLLLGLVLLFRVHRPALETREPAQAPVPDSASLAPWLAGACLAMSTLLRPNLALGVAVALAVWCLAPGGPVGSPDRSRGPRMQAAVRTGLAMLMLFAPLMLHNLAIGGRASPFGLQGGMTLYGGTHPGASGVGDVIPGCGGTPYIQVVNALAEAERRTGRELTLAEADAYWYGLVWKYFREQPGEAASLLGRKALLLVNNRGLDSTANMAFWSRFSPVPGWLALPVGLLFALAAAGLWRCARRGPQSLALAAACLSLCGAAVFFHVTPRYRLVLLPLVLVFAGAGLGEARAMLAESWRRKAAPLALFLLVLGLSLIPLERLVHKPDPLAMEHARLAHYLLLTGRFAEALPEYEAALALGPRVLDDPAALRAEREAARRLAQGAGRTP